MADKDDEGKGLDARGVFAIFALVLSIGAGGFYHLSGQLAEKADIKAMRDPWTGAQMSEYKTLESERHSAIDKRFDALNARIDRLESIVLELHGMNGGKHK